MFLGAAVVNVVPFVPDYVEKESIGLAIGYVYFISFAAILISENGLTYFADNIEDYHENL